MDEDRNQSKPPMQGSPPHEPEPDYSEDGVDLTLIRWMLSLTPTDRLEVLQSAVRSLARFARSPRRGGSMPRWTGISEEENRRWHEAEGFAPPPNASGSTDAKPVNPFAIGGAFL